MRVDVTYPGNGESTFSTLDAMFVNITLGNANQPHILGAVQDEFGRNFTIIGNDGFKRGKLQYVAMRYYQIGYYNTLTVTTMIIMILIST